MLDCFLDNVLSLEEIVRHQLTVVVLEISKNVSHGVIYEVFCAIADIRDIRLLECGNYLFDKVLIDSRHFSKNKFFLVVGDSHVWVHVGGCDVQDDEWNRVSWVDEGNVQYYHVLRIGEH